MPRSCKTTVIERLLDEPYRVEFFQAVRIIELWLRRNGIAADQTLSEYIRFRNSVALSFPPSQIESLRVDADTPVASGADLLAALRDGHLRHIAITPAFIGFLGVNGTLPFHATDRIAAHEHATRDDGPRAFLDLFSNRSVALFYQAWSKYRLEYKLDAQGGDGFLPMLLALAGVRPASAPETHGGEPGAIDNQTLGFYAAQLRGRAVPAATIAGVLSEYFAVPVRLEQFIGGWDVFAPEHRMTLGGPNMVLGGGAMLGDRVWRRDLRVRIWIGPLDIDQYECFFPGASGAIALKSLLGRFCTDALIFEVHVVLRAEDVRPFRLGARRGTRLGLDTFLLAGGPPRDRDGVIYELRP